MRGRIFLLDSKSLEPSEGVECCALCLQGEEWVGGTSEGRWYWWPKVGREKVERLGGH